MSHKQKKKKPKPPAIRLSRNSSAREVLSDNIKHHDKQNIEDFEHMVNCDIVVGGGGTMNREAALLGLPVYSLFMGKMGTIDRMLADQGRLTWVRSVEDVTLIKFKKREKSDINDLLTKWKARSSDLSRFICEEVLRTARHDQNDS